MLEMVASETVAMTDDTIGTAVGNVEGAWGSVADIFVLCGSFALCQSADVARTFECSMLNSC